MLLFKCQKSSFQDAGVYVCGASNAVNQDGDKENGVVFLNMEKGRKKEKTPCHQGRFQIKTRQSILGSDLLTK